MSYELSRHLYVTLISPLFEYCNQVYDGCFTVGARKLQSAQNGALRVVLQRDKHSDTSDLHTDSNIPWLDVSRKINTCCEVYKLTHGTGPQNLTHLFQQLPPPRNLRSSNGIQHHIHRTRTKFAERDFVHRGKQYWREIPYEVQNATSVNAFKHQLISRQIFKHER